MNCLSEVKHCIMKVKCRGESHSHPLSSPSLALDMSERVKLALPYWRLGIALSVLDKALFGCWIGLWHCSLSGHHPRYSPLANTVPRLDLSLNSMPIRTPNTHGGILFKYYIIFQHKSYETDTEDLWESVLGAIEDIRVEGRGSFLIWAHKTVPSGSTRPKG